MKCHRSDCFQEVTHAQTGMEEKIGYCEKHANGLPKIHREREYPCAFKGCVREANFQLKKSANSVAMLCSEHYEEHRHRLVLDGESFVSQKLHGDRKVLEFVEPENVKLQPKTETFMEVPTDPARPPAPITGAKYFMSVYDDGVAEVYGCQTFEELLQLRRFVKGQAELIQACDEPAQPHEAK